MSRAERIELRLPPFAETADAVRLTQRGKPLATARQNLMRITLVRHVPNDLILGHVEHVVQRHRQFDHSQTGAQVTARLRHVFQHFPAQLVRQLFQLAQVQALHVGRKFYGIEDGFDGGTAVRRAGGSLAQYGVASPETALSSHGQSCETRDLIVHGGGGHYRSRGKGCYSSIRHFFRVEIQNMYCLQCSNIYLVFIGRQDQRK
mmetsp:Transcript_32147/g.73961  ORF Transcript_32147/g.73961 Transcript_32147/m.73961 type:complete len:204 (-) Transcript_32147:163-774(-)